MARQARIVHPGSAHHVIARGVNRCALFHSAHDKLTYLQRFQRVAAEEQITILGYCLMDNHMHWILTPSSAAGLHRLFQRVHTWWAQWFNRRYGRSGHLFQGRFSSSLLETGAYQWTALRYVELNPVRADLAEHPEDFRFSSARTHCTGIQDSDIPIDLSAWQTYFTAHRWRDYLKESYLESQLRLEKAMKSNKPLGCAAFIAEIEARTGRRLILTNPGRPPKLAPKPWIPSPALQAS